MTQTAEITQALIAPEFLAGKRIAFVHALWHADIVREAYLGFIDEAGLFGAAPKEIEKFEVPGAFEIPLLAQRLARTGRYDAIVGAGFVIDGGIYRHEFVAETVVSALMRVQLDTGTPVFSVVLTPHHFHEHQVHHRFFHSHFREKGAEAARAVNTTLAAHALADAKTQVS